MYTLFRNNMVLTASKNSHGMIIFFGFAKQNLDIFCMLLKRNSWKKGNLSNKKGWQCWYK